MKTERLALIWKPVRLSMPAILLAASLLASDSAGQRAKSVGLSSGQELLTLRGHSGKVWRVAFSPDGKRLASAGGDKTLKVWDATTGKETLTLKGHTGDVRSVAFSPDGKQLASGSWDRTVRVWDAMSGEQLITLTGHSREVNSVAFSRTFSTHELKVRKRLGTKASSSKVCPQLGIG